jgi:hypothetical protein
MPPSSVAVQACEPSATFTQRTTRFTFPTMTRVPFSVTAGLDWMPFPVLCIQSLLPVVALKQ